MCQTRRPKSQCSYYAVPPLYALCLYTGISVSILNPCNFACHAPASDLFEVEGHLLVGELVVHSSKSVNTSFDICLILAVKVDLEDPAPINLASCPLAHNFGGVAEVLKDGILDGRQCARAGAGALGLLGASVGLSKDGALGDNEDVPSRELLLELTDEALLDLVERFEQLVWNVQDDGLAATAAVDLLGGSDEEVAEGSLQLSGGHLQVEELLGDGGLELIGFL